MLTLWTMWPRRGRAWWCTRMFWGYSVNGIVPSWSGSWRSYRKLATGRLVVFWTLLTFIYPITVKECISWQFARTNWEGHSHGQIQQVPPLWIPFSGQTRALMVGEAADEVIVFILFSSRAGFWNPSNILWRLSVLSLSGSLPPEADVRPHSNVKLAYQEIVAKGGDPARECWVIDCGCTERFLSFRRDECPCLLHSRGSDTSYWCSSLGRYLNTEDRMKLQGFQCGPDRVSDSALNQMLGNAMSVTVVQAVLLQAVWAMGLAN